MYVRATYTEKASESPVTRLLAEAQQDAWPAWEAPPLSEAAAAVRSRGPAGRASIRAADDVLETGLQSDEILACFGEALGERLPEMGTDAAAGREALGRRGGPRGCPCGGEMGSHGPPQAPIFLEFFFAIFYLFSWEFGVLAAMLSRLATACRRS